MQQIEILDILRRHAWMIVALTIVATVAGYGFTFLLPEQFSATALVLVRPQQSIKIDTTKTDKEFMDFPVGQSSVVETPSKTYIEIIKGGELIGNVVRNLGLDKEKEESGRLSKLLPMKDIKQFFKTVRAFVKYGRYLEDDQFTKAVKEVQENLALKSIAETYIFEIKYA